MSIWQRRESQSQDASVAYWWLKNDESAKVDRRSRADQLLELSKDKDGPTLDARRLAVKKLARALAILIDNEKLLELKLQNLRTTVRSFASALQLFEIPHDPSLLNTSILDQAKEPSSHAWRSISKPVGGNDMEERIHNICMDHKETITVDRDEIFDTLSGSSLVGNDSQKETRTVWIPFSVTQEERANLDMILAEVRKFSQQVPPDIENPFSSLLHCIESIEKIEHINRNIGARNVLDRMRTLPRRDTDIPDIFDMLASVVDLDFTFTSEGYTMRNIAHIPDDLFSHVSLFDESRMAPLRIRRFNHRGVWSVQKVSVVTNESEGDDADSEGSMSLFTTEDDDSHSSSSSDMDFTKRMPQETSSFVPTWAASVADWFSAGKLYLSFLFLLFVVTGAAFVWWQSRNGTDTTIDENVQSFIVFRLNQLGQMTTDYYDSLSLVGGRQSHLLQQAIHGPQTTGNVFPFMSAAAEAVMASVSTVAAVDFDFAYFLGADGRLFGVVQDNTTTILTGQDGDGGCFSSYEVNLETTLFTFQVSSASDDLGIATCPFQNDGCRCQLEEESWISEVTDSTFSGFVFPLDEAGNRRHISYVPVCKFGVPDPSNQYNCVSADMVEGWWIIQGQGLSTETTLNEERDVLPELEFYVLSLGEIIHTSDTDDLDVDPIVATIVELHSTAEQFAQGTTIGDFKVVTSDTGFEGVVAVVVEREDPQFVGENTTISIVLVAILALVVAIFATINWSLIHRKKYYEDLHVYVTLVLVFALSLYVALWGVWVLRTDIYVQDFVSEALEEYIEHAKHSLADVSRSQKFAQMQLKLSYSILDLSNTVTHAEQMLDLLVSTVLTFPALSSAQLAINTVDGDAIWAQVLHAEGYLDFYQPTNKRSTALDSEIEIVNGQPQLSQTETEIIYTGTESAWLLAKSDRWETFQKLIDIQNTLQLSGPLLNDTATIGTWGVETFPVMDHIVPDTLSATFIVEPSGTLVSVNSNFGREAVVGEDGRINAAASNHSLIRWSHNRLPTAVVTEDLVYVDYPLQRVSDVEIDESVASFPYKWTSVVVVDHASSVFVHHLNANEKAFLIVTCAVMLSGFVLTVITKNAIRIYQANFFGKAVEQNHSVVMSDKGMQLFVRDMVSKISHSNFLNIRSTIKKFMVGFIEDVAANVDNETGSEAEVGIIRDTSEMSEGTMSQQLVDRALTLVNLSKYYRLRVSAYLDLESRGTSLELKCYHIYLQNIFRRAQLFTSLLHVGLLFYEAPDSETYRTSEVYRDDERRFITIGIEAFCILMYTLDAIVRITVAKLFWPKTTTLAACCKMPIFHRISLYLLVLLGFFYRLGDDHLFISRLARPILIIISSHRTRGAVTHFIRTIASARDVFLLFGTIVFVFAASGAVFFPPSLLEKVETDNHYPVFRFGSEFNFFRNPLLAVFILMTTAENYADIDVLLSPTTAGVVYLFIAAGLGFFMLNAMLIGVFQQAYTDLAYNQLLAARDTKREGLLAGFACLYCSEQGPLAQSSKKPLLISRETFCNFALLWKRKTATCLSKQKFVVALNELLDTVDPLARHIDVSTFVELCEIIDRKMKVVREDVRLHTEFRLKLKATVFQSSLYRYFEYTLLGAEVSLLFVMATFRDNNGLTFSGVKPVHISLLVFSAIGQAFTILKLFTYGIRPMIFAHTLDQRARNRFDIFILLIAVVCATGLAVTGMDLNDASSGWYQSLVVIPVFRIFMVLKRTRRILVTFTNVLPPYIPILIFFFGLFFVFAVVGSEVFASLNDSAFHDMYRTCRTLFQSLIGENWPAFMYTAMEERRSYTPAVFFAGYIIVVHILFANLIIGILIDSFQKIFGKKSVMKESFLKAGDVTQQLFAEFKDPGWVETWGASVTERISWAQKRQAFKKLNAANGRRGVPLELVRHVLVEVGAVKISSRIVAKVTTTWMGSFGAAELSPTRLVTTRDFELIARLTSVGKSQGSMGPKSTMRLKTRRISVSSSEDQTK